MIQNATNTGIETQANGSLQRAGTTDGLLEATMRAVVFGDFTLAAASGVQTAFPSTCDTWTLEATTTYRVRGRYFMTTGTTTTKTTAIAFLAGGGLTISSMALSVRGYNAIVNTAVTSYNCLYKNRLAVTVVTPTSTLAGVVIEFEGHIRVNAGGTLTPQISFSANPGGTNLMKEDSFIEFTPLGSNTFEKFGNVG